MNSTYKLSAWAEIQIHTGTPNCGIIDSLAIELSG